jgi:tetratricopeptide (TPR) repeat protein
MVVRLVGALLVVVLLGTAAHAGEGILSAERANQLLEKGNGRYRVRDYPGALQLYQAAQEAGAEPLVLFNLAQTHRKLGDLEKALSFFTRYLEAVPAAPNRPTVERLIQGVRAELQRRGVTVPGPSAALPATPVVPPVALGRAAAVEMPAGPSGTPWYRRWYVWVPIAVVVTGAAVGGGVAASRGGPPATPLGNHNFFLFGAR